MNEGKATIIMRLTALWAFSEAFLGGILHAFHLPFTGLILSSIAVLCIVCIALQGYTKGQILKATLLVLLIKAMISPHTPVSAYFAVLLQGAFCELIFLLGTPFVLSCFVVAIAALMQSAFQKLIILTLLFGVDFWSAMDEFLNSIAKQFGIGTIEYTNYLVMMYLLLHFLVGIVVGSIAVRLPKTLVSSTKEFEQHPITVPDNLETEMLYTANNKRKNRFKYWIAGILLIWLAFDIYSEGTLSAMIHSKALKLIVRASIFIIVWYFFLSPLLYILFQKWLAKQRSKFSLEINVLLKLLPEIKYITAQCWVNTSDLKGMKRIFKFIRYTFFVMLHKENANTPA
ncbi:MAG TPA: hypothetical protein PLN13_01660 [Bacteroidia bacterium]|nr:hypothetical protein [Bacteroidia bacterium]HRH07261.1 hypothetical protein [Bacteroidia bacterium]